MLYAGWLNTSTSQWTHYHVNGTALFKGMSSLFVSQQGLLLSVCTQIGCVLTCAWAFVPVFSSSPREIYTSLSVVSPVLWPSLEVVRMKQCSCLQGIHWVTAQAGGHEADVHPARTQTEAHQQKLPHMGSKQRSIQPHTRILSTPSSFLLHACMKRWGVKERQGEERQHWFLLYRFRKPVFFEKSDAELLISSFNFDAFLLLEN